MNEAEFEAAANEVINKAAQPAEEVVESVEAVEPEAQVMAVDEAEAVEEAVEKPEGYLGYEEYIAQGRDPAFFRGEKAYEKQKELIAQAKESDSRFKTLDENLFKLQQFNEEQREQEQQKLLREKAYLQRELLTAREALDIDKHEAIKERIGQVDERITPATAQSNEPEVFVRARQADPRINPASPSFDKYFNGLVEIEVNESVNKAAAAVGRVLTDNEVMDHIDSAKKKIDAKLKPAAKPKVRPAEVSAPTAATQKPSENDAFAAAQFKRWAKSNDPTMKAAGERWLQRNNIK